MDASVNERLRAMTLPELAERLEDLDHRRTPVGWSPDDAVERASIERCILEQVASRGAATAGIACDCEIRLRSKEVQVTATIREVRPGGLVIAADGTWIPGTHVEMQLQVDGSDEHGLRARGIVASAERGTVIVTVAEQPSEAHERRLQRFVLELVRHGHAAPPRGDLHN